MARSADPVLAERRRRQILDAAMACFRRRGFHQTSMQEICAEAHLSAGALYRYFASKAEIISAIAEDDWRGREPLFEAIERGPDVVAAVCALAEHALETCGADGSLVAEVIAESIRDPEMSQRFADHDAIFRRRLTLSLAAAQRRGLAKLAMTPDHAAGIVMLMLDGLVLRAAGFGAARARPLLKDFRVAVEHTFVPAPPPPRRAVKLVAAEIES